MVLPAPRGLRSALPVNGATTEPSVHPLDHRTDHQLELRVAVTVSTEEEPCAGNGHSSSSSGRFHVLEELLRLHEPDDGRAASRCGNECGLEIQATLLPDADPAFGDGEDGRSPHPILAAQPGNRGVGRRNAPHPAGDLPEVLPPSPGWSRQRSSGDDRVNEQGDERRLVLDVVVQRHGRDLERLGNGAHGESPGPLSSATSRAARAIRSLVNSAVGPVRSPVDDNPYPSEVLDPGERCRGSPCRWRSPEGAGSRYPVRKGIGRRDRQGRERESVSSNFWTTG